MVSMKYNVIEVVNNVVVKAKANTVVVDVVVERTVAEVDSEAMDIVDEAEAVVETVEDLDPNNLKHRITYPRCSNKLGTMRPSCC